MADTAITRVTLGENVPSRQVEIPNYNYGVVALADILAHALVIDGRGKRALTVHVVNETDQDVTVTVYGAYASDDVSLLNRSSGNETPLIMPWQTMLSLTKHWNSRKIGRNSFRINH